MAHPTTFMLQHNNISQFNSNYYTNNISKKYKGYKYKFSHILPNLINFCLKKKSRVKIFLLYRKIFLKRRKINYFIKFLKFRTKKAITRLYNFDEYPFLRFLNMRYVWYFFEKKFFVARYKFSSTQKWKKKYLKRLVRRSIKKFKIKLTMKKKKLNNLLKYKYQFKTILLRLIKIKNISFLFFIIKRIANKKYSLIKVKSKTSISEFLNKKTSH